MPITLSVDLGTTTITALALDTGSGEVLRTATCANDAETTTPEGKVRGRSEWDAGRIGELGLRVLREMAAGLGEGLRDVAAIGLTGQQHGVVLVDGAGAPVSPLVNWQDRRGEEEAPGSGGLTYTQQAAALLGPDAPRRAGCSLATGFMGLTLYWMQRNGALPAGATACFVMDYLFARLTGGRPVCDATNGASSGLFDLARGTWDDDAVAALGFSRGVFPEVRETGEPAGKLSRAAAEATGLPRGLPVCVAMGDHQASYLGSIADRERTLLVNVGTGAQVARYADGLVIAPPIETRPFPRGGCLLVEAGLSGGKAYALLQRFFRQVGADVLQHPTDASLYAAMNALAEAAPPGADGLRCDPCFAGTRHDPDRRGVWSGMSEANFTPGHMARALIEGQARSLHEAAQRVEAAAGASSDVLVGSGNGIRENPLFAGVLSREFGLPITLPAHREEAAYGAALMAGVGVGVWESVAAACRAGNASD